MVARPVAEIITVDDLPADVAANALAQVWLDGANAQAARVAPCLGSDDPAPTEAQLAEARLVLLGAIIRWSQAGSGALQSQSALGFSQTIDTRQRTGFALWPSEITRLQDICKAGDHGRRAFAIDTIGSTDTHSPICSLHFGAGYCSCGVALSGGGPIWEQVTP